MLTAESAASSLTALYKTDDGFRLGAWVSKQRQAKNTTEPDRRLRLEMLPGWSWDVLSDWWEEGFSHLKQFAERERPCRVPISYRTENGYILRQWTAIIGGAWRRCRVGLGMLGPTNGRRGSFI
jgi:hypothetical protein